MQNLDTSDANVILKNFNDILTSSTPNSPFSLVCSHTYFTNRIKQNKERERERKREAAVALRGSLLLLMKAIKLHPI